MYIHKLKTNKQTNKQKSLEATQMYFSPSFTFSFVNSYLDFHIVSSLKLMVLYCINIILDSVI